MNIAQSARVCALLALAGLLAGCEKRWNQERDLPFAFAVPEVARPVGPVPGPAVADDGQPNPLAGDLQAVRAGRKLFVYLNCVGCHGGRGGGGMGPSLRDQDWIYGGKPSDIYSSIAQGGANGMPAWGTKIPRQEIWELVAYIQSLGKPYEPEKPE